MYLFIYSFIYFNYCGTNVQKQSLRGAFYVRAIC